MGRNIFKQITALTCGLLIAACLFLLPSAARAESGNMIQVRDTGGISAAQAFMGYFRRLSRGGIRQTSKGIAAGDKLQGADARLYAALKTQIEEAADGKRISTRFTVPAATLFDQVEYTFEELGFLQDTVTESELITAYLERNPLNQKNVVRSLLYDCPYDLYWFDKTAGYSMPDLPTCVTVISSTRTVRFKNSDLEYRFKVAVGYQDPNVSDTEYTISDTFAWAAGEAAKNARQIVDANKGKTDLKKLEAYRDRICALVSYGMPNDGTPYGDPWQLIYVFDGIDSTNVVCEGYSKAFQFLCDESSFTGNVRVLSVTGRMSQNGSGGDHMWNLVTMGNGKKYLADITNSDEGTAGSDGSLFLAGYKSTKSGADGKTAYVYGSAEIEYTYDQTVTDLFGTEELIPGEGDGYSAESGDCGTGMVWELDCDGNLLISGSGDTLAAGSWNGSRVKKLILQNGITAVPAGVFSGCDNLTEAVIPDSVETIGTGAFPAGTELTLSCGSAVRKSAEEQQLTLNLIHGEEETIPGSAADCEHDGKTDGIRCKRCKDILKAQQVIASPGHQWEKPVYTWAEDNSTVTAVRKCARDSTHEEKETAEAVSTILQEATYTAAGKRLYTAAFQNPAFEKQEKETVIPKLTPTPTPTPKPTASPTQTTEKPTETPTGKPSETPTETPTGKPSEKPTETPTGKPSEKPTETPTEKPSEKPTETPTGKPTETPTGKPTEKPSEKPTEKPSEKPTETPTGKPSEKPTEQPTPTAPVITPTPKPSPAPTSVVTLSSGIYRLNAKKKTAVFTAPKKKTVEKLTIPATIKVKSVTYRVTEIAKNACKGLKKLKTVKIGANVQIIGTGAFASCKALTTVTGGKAAVNIGASAFSGDAALKAFTLYSKVKNIGKNAFRNCKKLVKIQIRTSLLTSGRVGSDAFRGVPKTADILVPKKKLKAYTKLLLNRGIRKGTRITGKY